jgi:hypothetical protein
MNIFNHKALPVLCASVLFLGAPILGFAAKRDPEIRSPLGCKDVGYGFDLNVLQILPASVGDSQSLYFIYNKHKKAINLYQMRQSESSQSVYLNHTIDPGRWAVLSSSEPMKYICTIHNGKTTHGEIIDCQTGLKVCEYARVKYGMNNRGNYWLANGNTRGGAVRQVIYYGIIPR